MSRVKKDACVSVENKTKLFCFTAIVSTSVVFLCILTIVRVLLGSAFTDCKDVKDPEFLEVFEDMAPAASMKTFWLVNGSGGGSHKDRVALRIDDKSVYIQLKTFKNVSTGTMSSQKSLKPSTILMTVIEFETLNRVLNSSSNKTSVELLNGNRLVIVRFDHANDTASVTLFKKKSSKDTQAPRWEQKSLIDVTMDTLRRLLDHYPLINDYIKANTTTTTGTIPLALETV